jgi:hypothetical protein
LDGRTLVMRLMDDYLVVSTDRHAVLHFLQRVHQCFKPYGGGVNPLKTRVNFPAEVEVDGERVRLTQLATKDLHWCGFVVDTETLEVPCSAVPCSAVQCSAVQGLGPRPRALLFAITDIVPNSSHLFCRSVPASLGCWNGLSRRL